MTCCALSINGMDTQGIYEYRQATSADAPEIATLINTHAYKDSNNLVIVPKIFRHSYVAHAIESKRLFVASYATAHDRKIIGYKKLFCITDKDELSDILNHELHCNSEPVVCGIAPCDTLISHALAPQTIIDLVAQPTVTYLYDGADFTHQNHRGHGVNAALTAYALGLATESIIKDIYKKQSSHLAMLYGLTRENASIESDLLGGRSRGIVRQFIPCAQTIATACACARPTSLLLSRHHACKPSFDPDATECKPLSDECAVAGYGCLIACPLTRMTIKEDTVS